MTTIPQPPSFDLLLDYWLGELDPDREAEVEEQIFADDEAARRLEVIATIGGGVRRLVRAGALRHVLSVEALEGLMREGVAVRSYSVGPGETVPCSIGSEEFVAIRLLGPFEDADRIDLEMDSRPEGQEPIREHLEDVPIDRRSGEIVLLYPGDLIRSLPHTQVLYRLSAETREGRRDLEYRLDHTPAS